MKQNYFQRLAQKTLFITVSGTRLRLSKAKVTVKVSVSVPNIRIKELSQNMRERHKQDARQRPEKQSEEEFAGIKEKRSYEMLVNSFHYYCCARRSKREGCGEAEHQN